MAGPYRLEELDNDTIMSYGIIEGVVKMRLSGHDILTQISKTKGFPFLVRIL
jgi:hypothetical protein